MSYLPGLSSKSKVVFFRMPQFSRIPVNMSKIKSLVLSPDPAISLDRRMDVLRDRAQYILVKEPAVKDYYASYPKFFDVQKVGEFWMIKFRKSGP
jgi:hypothetical protein